VRRSPDTVPKDHVDANLPGLRSPSELNRSPWSGKRPSLLGSVRAARPIGPVSAPVAPPPTFPPSVNSGAESYSALRPHGSPREVTFRPRGFAPPRRFPPLDGLRACCIPLPVMRFAAFPSFPTRRSPERLPRSAGFVPLEGLSPSTAAPRHRGRCLPAVLPRPPPQRATRRCRCDVCCGGRVEGVGFKALLRRRAQRGTAPLPV